MKILNTQNCILKNIYEDMYSTQCENSWIFMVKDLLCSAGFSNLWYAQNVPNQRKLFLKIKQRLFDVFVQERDAFFACSSKCYVYKYLYDPFGLQYYLKKCISENIVHYLTKYRLSAHRLAIEQGRYNQVYALVAFVDFVLLIGLKKNFTSS